MDFGMAGSLPVGRRGLLATPFADVPLAKRPRAMWDGLREGGWKHWCSTWLTKSQPVLRSYCRFKLRGNARLLRKTSPARHGIGDLIENLLMPTAL